MHCSWCALKCLLDHEEEIKEIFKMINDIGEDEEEDELHQALEGDEHDEEEDHITFVELKDFVSKMPNSCFPDGTKPGEEGTTFTALAVPSLSRSPTAHVKTVCLSLRELMTFNANFVFC